MKLKIGDKVKIVEGTRYYDDDSKSNPNNIEGEITTAEDCTYYVEWSNGTFNSYEEGDLELYEPINIENYEIY